MVVVSALMGLLSLRFGVLKDQDLTTVYSQAPAANQSFVSRVTCAQLCARDIRCAAFSYYDGGSDRSKSGCRLGAFVSANTFGRPGWRVYTRLRRQGFGYGCFKDDAPPRLFVGGVDLTRPAVTRSNCIQECRDRGHVFGGPEYGGYCICGTVLTSPPTELPTVCTAPCGGNPSETCGGLWKVQLFETGIVA